MTSMAAGVNSKLVKKLVNVSPVLNFLESMMAFKKSKFVGGPQIAECDKTSPNFSIAAVRLESCTMTFAIIGSTVVESAYVFI